MITIPAQLANMNLFQPLNVKSAAVENGDITWACWPTYRRQTLAQGGDHMSTWSFSASDEILDRWFDEYLGCHFEESFGGVGTFSGLVYTMRLSYNGVVLTKSLDDMANSVRVSYKTDSAAAEAITTAVTNPASIARYGTKEHLEKLGSIYISPTTAGYYADNLLAALSQIRAAMEEARLSGASQPGTLQVEVRGYVHTLNWRTITNASTTTVAASAAITAALASAEFVSAGAIATNAATISEEAASVPLWERIKAITKCGSSTQRYLAGCYAGTSLDYQPADETTIAYEQEMRTRRRLTYLPGSGEIVPAPLVRPGRVVFVRDLMSGRPISPSLLDDPRAQFVEMVEYSMEGAVLKGEPRRDADKASALALALKTINPRQGRPVIDPIVRIS
ncbi:MAG: hypothetical protein IPM39_29565 [Chloroflexi bacterium]|nr:hypothetical protein [Chloroflexota bacterium]